MSTSYVAARAISRVFGLRRLVLPPAKGLRILMYHAIGSPVDSDPKQLYSLSESAFEEHLRALSTEPDVRFVQMDSTEVLADPTGALAVTFDDGYRDNLLAAAPLLKLHGIPFSVFVITQAVRNGERQFLSASDVRRLAEEYNAVIGSHGATHARLAECSNRQLKDELVSSKSYLEDLLGKEIVSLSYPHGSVDRRVRDMAAESGYRLGMTSFFGVNNVKADPILLARLPIVSPDNVAELRAKVNGDWDWYRWRQFRKRRAARR